MPAAGVVSVAETVNRGLERNDRETVSQVSKLRFGAVRGVVQKQCASPRAGHEPVRITGFDLLTDLVEFYAVNGMKKRASLIRQVAPNYQTRTTGAVETFRALDQTRKT